MIEMIGDIHVNTHKNQENIFMFSDCTARSEHRGSQLYFHIARYMLKEKGGHFFAAQSESRISAPFFASKTV
jgi:hypothetical protein